MSDPILYGPMDYRPPGSSVLGISGMKNERQEYWNGLLCPPPEDLETKGRVHKLEDLSEEITKKNTDEK